MSAGRIHVDHLSIELGEGAARFEVLRDLSVTIEPGEFVCLLGPSGCGKSTLLGALAGHLSPSQGRLSLDGEAITGPDPDRGLVFQQHTLFPWKTVLDNVGYGLKMKGVPRAERERRATELLQLVGLQGFERRYPRELSGGMQQRAALCRALLLDPPLLLMDEPFGALDAMTRDDLNLELLRVWGESISERKTILFVTHSIPEAVFLADKVVVLAPRPGRVAKTFEVALPRPRTPATRALPEFGRLALACHEALARGAQV